MKELPAAVQANSAADRAAAAGLLEISVVLEQAPALSSGQTWPAAEGLVTVGNSIISALIEKALSVRRQKEAVGEHGVAAEAEEATRGEMGLPRWIGVDGRRRSAVREAD